MSHDEEQLCLLLHSCQQITDTGVQSLSAALKQLTALHTLTLVLPNGKCHDENSCAYFFIAASRSPTQECRASVQHSSSSLLSTPSLSTSTSKCHDKNSCTYFFIAAQRSPSKHLTSSERSRLASQSYIYTIRVVLCTILYRVSYIFVNFHLIKFIHIHIYHIPTCMHSK